MRAIAIGDEAMLVPAEFSLEGRAIRKVRQSVSRLTKAGYRFRVVDADDIDPTLRAQLDAVSEAWRGNQAERGFSMAMDDLYAPGTTFAIAESDAGEVGGFLHLAPSPAGGGWSLSTMRRLPGTPNGLTEFLVVETLAWAKEHDVSELSLNFCALTDFVAPDRALTVPRRLVRRVLLAADGVFQLERLHSFSRKFHPHWRPRYLCVEKLTDLPLVGLAYLHVEQLLVPPGHVDAPRARVTLDAMAQQHGDAQPRPALGDRAGDGAARLRLLPRGAQAHRPAARAARPRLRLAAAHETGASARGAHLRDLLDELGPTFVKFGQLLSTRPDIVPPDIIAELRGLQDDVRPFPFEQAERVIVEDLGNSIERLFLDFEREPVAAASIGQVHRATLPNGKQVAVKVQRPGAPRQIEADLALLYQAAKLVKERVHALDFIDARGLIDEFAGQIRQELDYRLEARNAQTFHHNFAGEPHVHVPKVYWSYTRARVLTLEWLQGTQLADVDTLPLSSRSGATSRTRSPRRG